MRVSEFGEEALIAAFADIYRSREGVLVGIGDDGAIISTDSSLQVVTTDMATEGIHFNRAWSSARDIGAKIAIANLADVYAMAGAPKFLIVALSVPADEEVSFLLDLARGIEAVAEEFEVSVVGGDIVAAGALTISITAIGSVSSPKLRSLAKVGQKVFLTRGTGKSLAGLLLLTKGIASAAAPEVAAFQRPDCHPRDLLGFGLENIEAMMDVSDGLLTDLPKIAAASKVRIDLSIDESQLSYLTTLSEKVGLSPLELFLRSGEEHSFVVVVATENLHKVPTHWIMLGEVVEGGGITYRGNSLPFQSKSWHWQ